MNTTKVMGKLAELMGADKEQVKRIENINFDLGTNSNEKIIADLKSGTIEERHRILLSTMKQTLKSKSFENCDVVECDNALLNEEMVEIVWKNINVYAYDIETFFLNRFVFMLKDNKDLVYQIYFSIENDNIFIYALDKDGHDFAGGTILIRDGKFIPVGAIPDEYYSGLKKYAEIQNIQSDREFIANRTVLNCLLYILLVNQMVNQNREVITETSKRIDLPTKKKSKRPQKKTANIRYIKVDSMKVKKVREDYEKQTRESYNRHVAEWSRRGYWTTLRNGKRHYVKPTTCHAKDKVEDRVQPKIYKLK